MEDNVLRFERFLDAVDWLEEEGFEESLHLDNHWLHGDGRRADVFRDIDHTGQDDSPTGVSVIRPKEDM